MYLPILDITEANMDANTRKLGKETNGKKSA